MARDFARLVPELYVADLAASLRFWCGLVGFRVRFDRPEEGFAYLERDGAEVMLEQLADSPRTWRTAALERPLGRGINFQIEVDDLAPILARLRAAGVRLFWQPEERWYRDNAIEHGQRQFLVQDPDGYLLRLAQVLGTRPVRPAA